MVLENFPTVDEQIRQLKKSDVRVNVNDYRVYFHQRGDFGAKGLDIYGAKSKQEVRDEWRRFFPDRIIDDIELVGRRGE